MYIMKICFKYSGGKGYIRDLKNISIKLFILEHSMIMSWQCGKEKLGMYSLKEINQGFVSMKINVLTTLFLLTLHICTTGR